MILPSAKLHFHFYVLRRLIAGTICGGFLNTGAIYSSASPRDGGAYPEVQEFEAAALLYSPRRGATIPIMPRSLISADEFHKLLLSILTPGQANWAVKLLEACHEGFRCVVPPGPHERFFEKALAYRDFERQMRYFQTVDDTVVLASIQFKRKSRFPAPFLNRNKPLVREIKRILDSHYGTDVAQYVAEEQGSQSHYLATAECLASDPWEEWGSECALYDEPHSSGQTPPDKSTIRNDFVILRFKRQDRPND